MNQPPSVDPLIGDRRSVPPSPPPPQATLQRSKVPWVGLVIWGLIFGALTAVCIQTWRWVQPMFAKPPLPPFVAENPLVLPPVATAETPSEEPPSADSSDNAAPPAAPTLPPERPDVVPLTLGNGSTGRVIEPIGLALRAEPNFEASLIGGIAFDEIVTILELSDDSRWQRVRRAINNQEGWVKAGNIVEANP